MAENTLTLIQEEILARLKSKFVQPIYEVALPDSETLIRDKNGKFVPYIAIQFGDLQQQGSRNMAHAWGHNYVMPIYCGSVAPDASTTRKLANKLNMVLLGYTNEYTGEMEKRAGGMMYPIPAQMGAFEAMVAPASFGLPVQILEV